MLCLISLACRVPEKESQIACNTTSRIKATPYSKRCCYFIMTVHVKETLATEQLLQQWPCGSAKKSNAHPQRRQKSRQTESWMATSNAVRGMCCTQWPDDRGTHMNLRTTLFLLPRHNGQRQNVEVSRVEVGGTHVVQAENIVSINRI